MSGNVLARIKYRKTCTNDPPRMVGEPVNGVGRTIFGRSTLLRSRVSCGKDKDFISNVNQLGGVGQFRTQFSVKADSVNKNLHL